MWKLLFQKKKLIKKVIIIYAIKCKQRKIQTIFLASQKMAIKIFVQKKHYKTLYN